MSSDHSSLDAVAGQCLDHLHREAAMLEGCREALAAVRRALRGNDGQQLLVAVGQQEESEAQLAAMAARRGHMARRLAASLQAPPGEATVRLLQARLRDETKRSQLDAARRRAAAAARQVERLCRGNAALIAHRIDLIRRLLAAFSASTSSTYQPQGIADTGPRSTMQRDC